MITFVISLYSAIKDWLISPYGPRIDLACCEKIELAISPHCARSDFIIAQCCATQKLVIIVLKIWSFLSVRAKCRDPLDQKIGRNLGISNYSF